SVTGSATSSRHRSASWCWTTRGSVTTSAGTSSTSDRPASVKIIWHLSRLPSRRSTAASPPRRRPAALDLATRLGSAAERVVARAPDLAAVHREGAHRLQCLAHVGVGKALSCLPWLTPAVRQVVEVETGLAVDEQRPGRVIRERVAPQHPPAVGDPCGRGELRVTCAAPLRPHVLDSCRIHATSLTENATIR